MRAKARVTLTIDMAVDSTWGPDCRADQILKQAAEEAIGHLRSVGRATSSRPILGDAGRGRVVGEPRVTMIFLTDDNDKEPTP